jgi:diadenosine tetraphosphate (Ap4A) HIT family hydrolase
MDIYETEFWVVKLNNNQAYLGRCVIVAKREVENLSSLTKEEWVNLQKVIQSLELAIQKAFNPRMFNWTCLMNNAFKAERYDKKKAKPHVHWHCKPRYNMEVVFNDIIFKDEKFAHHYDRNTEQIVDNDTLSLIAEEIKKCLNLL